jgi:hypothetical protein
MQHDFVAKLLEHTNKIELLMLFKMDSLFAHIARRQNK